MSALPIRILKGNMQFPQEVAVWNDPTNPSDPWAGYAYRWDVVIDVLVTGHSSPDTRQPFGYDALDIKVGDWVSSSTNGIAVQIIDILSVNAGQIKVRVEDVERFNIHSDIQVAGTGIGPTGVCYIFQLDDEGLPIMGPIIPFDMPVTFQNDMEARFRFRNLALKYVQVEQPGHTMTVGDLVRPDPENPGHYLKASADNFVDNAIGIVTDIKNPGANFFAFKPIGKLVNDVTPPLNGTHGDLFFVDPTTPGKLTNVRPANNARPIYMRLDKPNRAILLDRNNMDMGETLRHSVDNVVDGQTVFQMPVGTTEMLYMSINGIENDNYTFDELTGVLTFDSSSTGYGVEASDEVFFIYKS